MERSFGTVRDEGSKDGSRYSYPSGVDAMVMIDAQTVRQNRNGEARLDQIVARLSRRKVQKPDETIS